MHLFTYLLIVLFTFYLILEKPTMTENLKKLTGKNKNDYEAVAKHLVDDCDVELFKELVDNDDFLFDFVKNNVAQRLENAVNQNNYQNLIEFLKYYSQSYEDAIVGSLVKYADEDLTDLMLDKFENGCDNEKTYAAKYFAKVQDPLAYEFLRLNSYSDNEFLAQNCAMTLGAWHDEKSFDEAIEKLQNSDDFEKLSAVKFLTAYGDKKAVPKLFEAMKTSTMAENIAGEIPYLVPLYELIKTDYENALLAIIYITNALGEILPLSVVFDFELFEVFEELINNHDDSKVAIALLNARDKFDTLTENDEYLYDEDKNTKNEIFDIKKLLNSAKKKDLEKYINDELREDSPFVFTALDFATDELAIRELLKSNNQTLILKTAEVLKSLGNFDETARTVALLKVTDINIKAIIRAL